MNDTLIEVLQNILATLCLNDRLECTLVCRRWYNVLNKSTLVHRLSITDTQYRQFQNMLEYLPYRAAQVKYLTIHNSPFDERFINISNQARFLRTTCKLTKLKDFADCELVLQLARSNMCSNLKILELDFPYPTRLAQRNIISRLNNMPALEYLTLNNARFGLIELETMQHNLHSIKRLHLRRAEFASDTFPTDIIPSAQVTHLEIDIFQVDDLATHIQVYEYIGSKYSFIDSPVSLDRAISYHVDDYVLELYNRGIYPLCQKIGSQLDAFKFTNYCEGLDAFNRFDDWGVKLKDLTIESTPGQGVSFIEDLVQSQQYKYIQELVLEKVIPEPTDKNNEYGGTLNFNHRL